MKKGLLLSTLILCLGLNATAQDKKEEIKDILAKKWQSYPVSAALEDPSKPSPKTIPVAPKGVKPKSMEIPATVSANVVEYSFQDEAMDLLKDLMDKPEDRTLPAYMELGEGGEDERFLFYDIPVRMLASQTGLSPELHKKTTTSEKDVAAFWNALNKAGKKTPSFKEQIVPLFSQCREMYDLNDWTLFQLIKSYVEAEWSENPTQQTIAHVFLLNNLGIEAKIAQVGDHVSILLPAQQTIFGKSYITVNGMPYFLMEDDHPSNIRTYSQRVSTEVAPLNLALDHRDLVFSVKAPIQVEKYMGTLDIKLNLPVNQARCDFYNALPPISVKHYAHAMPDSDFAAALVKQLAPLRKKGAVAGVQALLYAIQMDFDYATDHQQFGREKPFFLEENFLYPFNDCEDRAILFTFLVKRLFKLDAILLEYPSHVAAAVCFNKPVPAGAYVQYNGRNYVICDPTYLGADIGMVIPHLKDTPAEIIAVR